MGRGLAGWLAVLFGLLLICPLPRDRIGVDRHAALHSGDADRGTIGRAEEAPQVRETSDDSEDQEDVTPPPASHEAASRTPAGPSLAFVSLADHRAAPGHEHPGRQRGPPTLA